MREIKFRAWDKVTKKMHVFDDCHMGRGFGVLLFAFDPPLIDRWDIHKSPEDQVDNLSHYELMQFTGLLDKNGVEIYEGDIARYKLKLGSEDNPFEETRAVSWFQALCEFYPVPKRDDCEDSWYRAEYYDFEVIGNIHENPELLEAR